MTKKHSRPHWLDQYFFVDDTKVKKQVSYYIKMFILATLFWISSIVQAQLHDSINAVILISHFHVLLSIGMVLGTLKRAFIVALCLNTLQFTFVTIGYIQTWDNQLIPSIIVPIFTILTITIIQMFKNRLNQKVNETMQQNEELTMLYEEMVATEEELERQNKQLHEYNRAMKENEEKLNYLAFFDSLTELPNRKMMLDRLELLIRLSSSKNMKFALIFIDLDNFKRINDSLGHHVGDLLLKATVSRLKSVVHADDLLGRLGGDEFALVIQRELKEAELVAYAEQIREVLLESYIIENTQFNITASFGVAIFPEDGDTTIELMKSADTAMYKAKEQGRNTIQFFNIEMRNETLIRINFESKLREAILRQELFLVYQAQYSPYTKELRGIEVLARWESAEFGSVSPTQFIPVAEETGLIIPLGEWIIRTACKKLKTLHDHYQLDIVMSINISSVQIIDPSFVSVVKSILDETGCNPQYIEFEITESVFISSMHYAIQVLRELKGLGLRIALDDFGTGYSSLNYLQQLPIDTLKIDQSFINSIEHVYANKPLVGSIISLVHQMNISVIAEGVENQAQLDYLTEESCDYIQGFYWGKPINEEDLDELVKSLNS